SSSEVESKGRHDWRIKELSSLSLDELIDNFKVNEVIMEKDSEIYKGGKERAKFIVLKAKNESSDDETSTFGSEEEEYAIAVRDFKKFFKRNGKFFRQPRDKMNENEGDEKNNEETCLMARSSNEVTLDSSYYSDNASSLDDDAMQIKYNNLRDISLKIINKNKILKTKRGLLEHEILELNEQIKRLERKKSIDIGYDRYAVSNGSRYAVLIYLSEYVVLDRKLDTPYWKLAVVESQEDFYSQLIYKLRELVAAIKLVPFVQLRE
ncbi:hypothetical protein Tco_0422667, partial [Tanacetum coccineum]